MHKQIQQWLNNRGINDDIIDLYKLHFENNQLVIPVMDSQGKVLFNKYRRDPIVENEKIPKYKYDKGATMALYGMQSLSNAQQVIVTEGECFPGNTEILTTKGWIEFKDYKNNKLPVAQYTEEGKIEFVSITGFIEKDGKQLITYTDKRVFFVQTTPNHNLIVQKDDTLYKIKANHPLTYGNIPRSGFHDGDGISLTDEEIKFFIAVSADFTIRRSGDLYAVFKKERKLERIRKILTNLDIPFSSRQETNGKFNIYICGKNSPLYLHKLFPISWIKDTSLKQKQLILSELVHWDGNYVPNRQQTEYASKEYHNALFVQTIAHLSGYRSTIMKRKNKFGEWYKVSILFHKRKSSWQGKNIKVENYTKKVYCVSVPSGMIIVRQKGFIYIAGNCDSLVLQSNGISTVSSTGGSGSFHDDWAKLFENKTVYICYDNDEAGHKGAYNTLNKVPHANIIWLPDSLGEGGDITDYFQKYTKEDFNKLIDTSKNYKIPNPQTYDFKFKKDFDNLIKEYKLYIGNFLMKEEEQRRNNYESEAPIRILIDLYLTKIRELQKKKKWFNYKPIHNTFDDNRIENAKKISIEHYINFGNTNFAKCIWHTEKTASMFYYQYNNRVKCFGCGRHGDTIDVVQQLKSVEFQEALKIILNNDN